MFHYVLEAANVIVVLPEHLLQTKDDIKLIGLIGEHSSSCLSLGQLWAREINLKERRRLCPGKLMVNARPEASSQLNHEDGCRTTSLDPAKTMVMGLDVNNASRRDITCSLDAEFSRCGSCVSVQNSNTELVRDIDRSKKFCMIF